MEKITLVSYLFFGFWIIKIVVVSYLDYRNVRAVQKHRDQVPKAFQDTVNLKEHQKAADYTVAKARYAQTARLVDNLWLAVLLPLGGASFMITVAQSFNYQTVTTGLLFFLLLGIAQLFLHLPLNYYYHFVLEEKFGFNKMTFKIFLGDLVKQMLLGLILGGVLLASVLFIMTHTDKWWLWAWLSTFSFQLLTLLIYPRFIAPLFNKFTPMEEGQYKEAVQDLSQRTNFPLKELFVMDASIRSSHGNAYFTGFGKNKRIVFFDTLLKTLTPNEVQAVLAHEIGHYHHKHILKSLIKAFFIAGFFFYLLFLLQEKSEFYLGHFVYQISPYSTLFLFLTVTPIYTFLFTPISTYLSRKNEYQADNFAMKHANGDDLAMALVKLYQENASSLVSDSVYSNFYYSHPPAVERIKNLRTKSN